MDDSAPVIPVGIQPKNVFGLSTDVVGNINFTLQQEVIYPVESVLAFHDYVSNKQKFLRFPENSHTTIIAISPNMKLLAVAEIFHSGIDEIHFVKIYELSTLKKRRTIQIPNTDSKRHVACMSFTMDSKALAILTKPPEETLYLYLFDKAETIVQGRAANTNGRGAARCIACNPTDPSLIAIGGDNVFKLMSRSEKGFTIGGNLKTDGICLTSLTWLSIEMLVAGTNRGSLLFIESGELKVRFDALQIDLIDLSQILEPDDGIEGSDVTLTIPSINQNTAEKQSENVSCLTAFQKGFAYAIFNTVFVFERESQYRFKRKTILRIEIDMYPKKLYEIQNIAINYQQDTIIATALHSQIYIGVLFVPDTLIAKELKFKTLGESLHIDEIIDLSVCAWKPIIMTASRDQTVRIWNYETGKIELVKKYQVNLTVIELHPSGLFAAAGFSDQLRLVEIFLNDLEVLKTYNFPRCNDVVFSHNGHLMAAAYDNLITIVSVFTFETMRTLKGHNGAVLCLTWSKNDKYLVSGGIEGAVYQWEVETGARINEVVQKGTEYRDVEILSDSSSTYAITNFGSLREMSNSEIVREIKTPDTAPLVALTLSRSDQVMFISSDSGHLYNVQLPFLESGGGTCTNYRFFQSPVTKLKITYDDTLLVTVSKRGTLAIWLILNNAGKIAPLDQDIGKCTEILIPRKALLGKLDDIQSLELRLKQQIDEFQYQMKQGDVFHSEQLRDIHKGYCDAIEELKYKNDAMESAHIEELNVITSNIVKTKEEHDEAIQQMEEKFHEKIIIEYGNSAKIKEQMDQMRDDYEEKLRKSAGCLQDTIETLEIDFKKQLQERQDLVCQLMQEMETKKTEFIEYCRQAENDNDRNMIEIQLEYEKKLKDEQINTTKWRNECGVLSKKYATISKEGEELRDEIDVLKEEHEKIQKTISFYENEIEMLRKEIEERDYRISEKEKRIQDLQRKNQELEKYKLVLNLKITELKSQIEPRERQIKEKQVHITKIERELEQIQQNKLKLELQLAELKDKYRGNVVKLEIEKNRLRNAKSYNSRICNDIYVVSGKLQCPNLLKEGVKLLHEKYVNDNEFKKPPPIDKNIEDELSKGDIKMIEPKISESKFEIKQKQYDSGVRKKLVDENVVLLVEINKLRSKLHDSQKRIISLESLFGNSGKTVTASAARQKLERACADLDEIDQKHKIEVDKLKKTVDILTDEVKNLRFQVITLQTA